MDRHIGHIANMLKEAALETLWPTRCVICDAPGMLLCNRCHAQLPFLDLWQACPTCGSAWGRLECCTCNPMSLGAMGLGAFPFDGCASALMLNEESGRIATVFKDGGEQRLAQVMAILMEPYAAPAWVEQRPFVTFVPATRDAYLRRGFDHAELLARELARRLGLPGGTLFERPHSFDQRALSREDRVRNMAAGFRVRRMWKEADAENGEKNAENGEAPSPPTAGCAGAGADASCGAGTERTLPVPKTLLIVDDVFTTGATLAGASMAAKRAGAETVYALTFARTP